jgi:4-diphosphocytidyl-2-C-methyl-D-erythritol kinase
MSDQSVSDTTRSRRQLTLLSPAKLNLFLHITGRRPDGYHTLQTLFQLLDYGDIMHFELLPTDETQLVCDDPQLQSAENLVLRAASALRERTGVQIGARITLNKKIPMGAGLGGGSSNAATTLVALNHLWQAGLSRAELSDIGVRLGADVPVFIHGRTAWGEGIGEQLTPVYLAHRFYIVLSPPCHVATREIFSNQQLTRDSTAIKMAAFLAGQSRNDCEVLVRKLYPDVDNTLNWLNQFASARMTGTGASVFAGFESREAAITVLRALSNSKDKAVNAERIKAFVASGIAESPVCALWIISPDQIL